MRYLRAHLIYSRMFLVRTEGFKMLLRSGGFLNHVMSDLRVVYVRLRVVHVHSEGFYLEK